MDAIKIWFENEGIFMQMRDGEIMSQSLKWYPRLEIANDEQRKKFRLSSMGIHWDELDEDVSFESFTYTNEEPQVNQLATFFNKHPEINVSQFAQRVGIPRSVFASYLCGTKKPSQKRIRQIETALKDVAQELLMVSF